MPECEIRGILLKYFLILLKINGEEHKVSGQVTSHTDLPHPPFYVEPDFEEYSGKTVNTNYTFF